MPTARSSRHRKTGSPAKASATLGDFLDELKRLEKRVDRRHAVIRDATSDNNVKLLTYFLRLHARRVARCTGAVLKWDPKALRTAVLPPTFAFNPRETLAILKTPPAELTGIQLLQSASRYHTQLLDAITAIRLHSSRGKVRCLLSDIVHLERQTLQMLRRMMKTQYF